ncbi:cyclic di-GMP phosphodiesterase response regulator RpfG [Clostridium homopropionicum DSM 5847]|uniref:Stage 0 sporulation protein A homolog n=1 Tax=Clostridium homopropionicum DSM 5847 TaxID=1121318 RepID=A0A0L6Z824_9CLOT|nr:HD domain-containing phosphohydrolase [Clostridium homopropionicum]KOA19115.1 cyclic di-GMP phosphodiesterase response regulator RpfG [Clostridium homopropionicum DSM 5847]SFG84073.1 putative two-component system response regulator [Clostridium homopropionicum]
MFSNTILIIDDDIKVIKSLLRIFHDYNYNILYTTDSKKAINIIDNTNIDVIITDQIMSPPTGIDILKYCNNINCKAIKILMTGYPDLSVAVTSINEGGIYHYFSKPWNDNEVRDVVRNAISLKMKIDKEDSILEDFYKIKKQYQGIVSDMAYKIETYRHSIIISMLKIIKSKDLGLYYHSTNVAKYSTNIAFLFDSCYKNFYSLINAALLHDIGKIAIRDKILYKPAKLNNNEFEQVKNHVIVGYEIVNDFDFLKTSASFIREHHERMDGSGYPKGLKFEDISFEGRLLGICDVFDALTSSRPYKEKYEIADSLDIILKGKGVLFDSTLVDILCENYNFIMGNENIFNLYFSEVTAT